MRVTCHFPTEAESSRWAAALQAAVGSAAAVSHWRAGDPAAQYAVTWRPTQQFFDEQTKLEAIFIAAAGADAVLQMHLPPGAQVVRLEDAGMGLQMAQYVSYAALRFLREFDTYQMQAQHHNWQPLEPRQAKDWPVGILGYGTLAQPVGHALKALGFPVHAWVRTHRANAPIPLFVGQEQLPQFLRATRILVCMLPLTKETHHILNADTLRQLPAASYLINVARGGHIAQTDLLQALDDGQLAGALLDVCDTEPAPKDHPFWKHPKISLTPHISAATLFEPSIHQIAEKIQRLANQLPITGIVGPAGY